MITENMQSPEAWATAIQRIVPKHARITPKCKRAQNFDMLTPLYESWEELDLKITHIRHFWNSFPEMILPLCFKNFDPPITRKNINGFQPDSYHRCITLTSSFFLTNTLTRETFWATVSEIRAEGQWHHVLEAIAFHLCSSFFYPVHFFLSLFPSRFVLEIAMGKNLLGECIENSNFELLSNVEGRSQREVLALASWKCSWEFRMKTHQARNTLPWDVGEYFKAF